jgi:hypothetical protein
MEEEKETMCDMKNRINIKELSQQKGSILENNYC